MERCKCSYYFYKFAPRGIFLKHTVHATIFRFTIDLPSSFEFDIYPIISGVTHITLNETDESVLQAKCAKGLYCDLCNVYVFSPEELKQLWVLARYSNEQLKDFESYCAERLQIIKD